jgi:hypothetical protein
MTAREWSLRHAELLRRERGALADLLVSLAHFDERALYRDLGFATLFDYLHRELRLSRGSAHYRQVATRLVGRFPEIVESLRDGRLCLTTVIVLARVMTEANRHEVLPRFFGLSRQEAEQVAVEIRPVEVVPRRTVVTGMSVPPPPPSTRNVDEDSRSTVELAPDRTLVEPLTARETRMHITVSPKFVKLLAKARAGQSHVQPKATDEQVLTAALELLLAQQEKRRASVPPRAKREVTKRDGAKCTRPLASGGVCGPDLRVEVDDVVPRGQGGPSTIDNCGLLCRGHNLEAARQACGDELMDLFAPRSPVVGEACSVYFVDVAADIPPSSTSSVPVTYDEASEASQAMASATSSAVPIRPIGTSAATCAARCARSGPSPSTAAHIGVSMAPGTTALHRTAYPAVAQWRATDRDTLITAALLAA